MAPAQADDQDRQGGEQVEKDGERAGLQQEAEQERGHEAGADADTDVLAHQNQSAVPLRQAGLEAHSGAPTIGRPANRVALTRSTGPPERAGEESYLMT